MARHRLLLAALLLLQIVAVVRAGDLAASAAGRASHGAQSLNNHAVADAAAVADAGRAKHGTALRDELSEESMSMIKQRVALGAEADPATFPTKPEEIRVLPELPGSELLGVGLNLREGMGMDAMMRPLIRARQWMAFAQDDKSFFRVSATLVARRNFRADMTTKVFSSNKERLMDLAVSAGVEFELGMFSGSAEAHVAITKQNDKKTMITQASLDVDLFDLSLTRYTPEDLDPVLMDEFNKLPQFWSEGPMQYQDFVKKWGTHFVRLANIGGAFEMVGTTTVSKDVDNLSVAANVKISLEMAIKVNAKGSVDYKSKNVNEQYQNNFDFHARGGDPAVGAMLATAQQSGGKDGKLEDACSTWLASLKKTPTIRNMKLGYLYELFGGVPGNGTARRQLAMKQAIDVFMREQDVGANVINLKEGKPMFSNFWHVNDQCLNFQAVVGPQSKLLVHLTSSARRLDLGYTVEIDMQRASIVKGGRVRSTTGSIAAIAPGSDVLYSTYIVCFDSRAGTVLYGRGRRVVLAYTDPRPEAAYYYGFSVVGSSPVTITALQVFNVFELTCPFVGGKSCGGRGSCSEIRMCQCDEGYLGFACEQECPLGINGTMCSRQGQCLADDSLGDSAKPYCTCKSGSIGKACEINELPTLSFDVRPMGPDGKLLSGRPLTFSLKRESSDGRAAAVQPASTQFSFEEPDMAEPFVVQNYVAFRTLSPGTVTVTGSITLPNNPDTVRISKTFTVLDCSCSGKGRCDATGTCVCRAGSSGPNCEDDSITGMLTVPASRMSTRTVTGKFIRPFSRIPKTVEVTIYEAPQNAAFTVTLASHTDRELTVIVARTDSMEGWDSEVRVMYRAVGARYVGKSKGKVTFPPAHGEVARTVAIQFPTPYGEAPFIHVRAAPKPGQQQPSGMLFRVLRSSPRGAVLEVSREEGTWNEPIDAEWTARPLTARDFYQHGEFQVGPRHKGPSRIYIEFPDVFRTLPTVELKAKSSIRSELFDVRVIELTQGGVLAEVAIMSGDSAEAGWQQNLVVRWKAYPKGFDKSLVESAQSAEFLPGRNLIGYDIGNPIQLPRVADEKDCAMACAQEPTCKGFTFEKWDSHCRGEWNGDNGGLVPAILAVDMYQRLAVKPVENGGWHWLPTWSGNSWGAVVRIIMLRDGRLLGVTHDARLALRRSLRDDWQVVPNGCCVTAVTELQDGRLVGVGTDRKLYVKENSGLTSNWLIKTSNHKDVDTRARSADEMEQIAAAREKEAFVEVEGEVQSESESFSKTMARTAPKSAIAAAAEFAKLARRPPLPTNRPRVSKADIERVHDFLDITQLVDGTIVAASTFNYLFTLKDPNGDWRDWHPVGLHSCCAMTVAAHPKGGVVVVGTNNWLYKMENSLSEDWQRIENSCCVKDAVAVFPKMSANVISEQPGRCYLKSIKPTRNLLPHSCYVSGYMVKRDEDGNVVNQPKTIGYEVRSTGWGDGCADWHYRSAHVIINGKVQVFKRGINVYLIGKDGSVEFAQSDTFVHDPKQTRGGGDANVERFLDVAMDAKQVQERGLIGIILTCHDECVKEMPYSMRSRIADIGLPAVTQAWTLRPAMLFIKDLRNGKIHSNIVGVSNVCSNIIRWGSFRADKPDDE